ncbi:redoxin domain-containing protein [Lyngbya aestuarii]|uniref:redoxin domain-containing protein n=1 Tax=Lyngbya aestuarii TaxID=118322 RepID=UPI00403DFD00
MEQIGTPVGSYAPDFELPGVDDQVHHLSRYLEQSRAVGVIFICNNCPQVLSYLERLKQLQAQFQNQGFTLIGINANDVRQHPEEGFLNMKKFAQERNLNFLYLWDSTQDVARSFGVKKTPEAFLIDEMGIVRYRGLIDDNAQNPQAVRLPYLQNAIRARLVGQDVFPPATEVVGSSLEWRN